MKSWGLASRLSRLARPSGTYALLALDHSLTHGLVPGLETPDRWIDFANNTSLSGIVLNPGHATAAQVLARKAVIIQTMGLPIAKGQQRNRVVTADVRSSIALGGDAIALQLSFEAEDLPPTIRTIAKMAAAARKNGIPVLLMIGGDHSDHFDLADKILIGNQLGADLIKVGLGARQQGQLRERLRIAAAWGAPVLLAGGSSSESLEESLSEAAEVGFRGVCVGRHIFQAQDPSGVVDLIDRYFPP
jgi:DhnA family fructose-bisphosphate aldolase class Ia